MNFALGDTVIDQQTGTIGKVTSVDMYGNILNVAHPPIITTGGSTIPYTPNWQHYIVPNPFLPLNNHQHAGAFLPVDTNTGVFDPVKAFLNGIGATFPFYTFGKCDSCKEETKEILIKYCPFKVERHVCKDCVVKKVDSIFGIDGIDPKTEKVLYGPKV